MASFHDAISNNDALAADPEIRSVLKELHAPLADYIATATRVISLAETDAAAAHGAMAAFQGKFKALEDAMERASDSIEGRAGAVAKLTTDHADQARLAMASLLALGIGLVAALVLLARQQVVRPIHDLTADMKMLASGRTEITIRGGDRRGEIGRAVRAFQDVIIRKTREEDEAAGRHRAREAEARQARRSPFEASRHKSPDGLPHSEVEQKRTKGPLPPCCYFAVSTKASITIINS